MITWEEHEKRLKAALDHARKDILTDEDRFTICTEIVASVLEMPDELKAEGIDSDHLCAMCDLATYRLYKFDPVGILTVFDKFADVEEELESEDEEVRNRAARKMAVLGVYADMLP